MRRQTFLGGIMSQTTEEFIAWEKFLADKRFNRLIEIGTDRGNLSLYLYLYCIVRRVNFFTYDIKDYDDSKVKRLVGLSKVFIKKDVFKSELGGIIKRDGVTILFCDGGNKIKEFNVFSKSLKSGDIIGAHDWGIEINDKDVKLDGLKFIFKRGRIKFFKKL